MTNKIKVVGWDVYGTLISSELDETRDDEDGHELKVRARDGALEVLGEIRRRNMIQCTVSDGDLGNLKDNLAEAGINRKIFDDLFIMTWGVPKDFSSVMRVYRIKPRELLIIGNSYEMDIQPALEQGCNALWVPEFIDSVRQRIDVRKVLDKIWD